MSGTKRVKLEPGRYEVPDVIHTKDLTASSIDVIATFGLDAPALLNKYACSVEDAFIETLQRLQDTKIELDLMTEAHAELKQKVAALEKKLLSESVAQ